MLNFKTSGNFLRICAAAGMLLFYCALPRQAAAFTDAWETVSGTGAGAKEDQAFAIETLQSGSTATVGFSRSEGPLILSGAAHPMVQVLDRTGLMVSVRQYGLFSDAENYDIIQLSNGDLVWVATIKGDGPYGWDMLICRTTVSLNTVWMKHISTWHNEYVTSVIECANGELAIAGYVDDDPNVNKFEAFAARLHAANGNTIWSNIYGSGYLTDERALCIRELSTGDFILAGRAEQPGVPGEEDALLIKINGGGVPVLASYYGPLNSNDSFRDMEIDGSDVIIAAGESCPTTQPTSNIMLAKVSSVNLLPLLPLNLYSSAQDNNTHCGAWGIDPSHQFYGEYVVTGYIELTANAPKELFLMEVPGNFGQENWARHFGDENNDDYGRDVAIFEMPHPIYSGKIERGYHVAGTRYWNQYSQRDWYNIRTGYRGTTDCDISFDLDNFNVQRDVSCLFGLIDWPGTTNMPEPNIDITNSEHVHCEAEVDITSGGIKRSLIISAEDLNTDRDQARNYDAAVPQGDALRINFSEELEGSQTFGVYDLQGRKMMSGSFNIEAANSYFELNTAELSPGLYLVNLSGGINIKMMVTP